MLIFPPAPGTSAGSGRRILLFGQGLVGTAIAHALQAGGRPAPEILPYPWEEAQGRATTRTALARACAAPGAIDLIWSAGRGGFGSSETEMATETDLLEEVLGLATGLNRPDTPVAIHLVSSAGGLFESQTDVGRETPPAPMRPYGWGKLAQEEALLATGLPSSIYRLSSVYGYRPGGRLGLISALMVNALAGRQTPITGQLETRRDYVLATDAGGFIAQRILTGATEGGTFLLASGRSTPISEILAEVEGALAQPLSIALADTLTNTAHMSFAPQALPRGWHPTSLSDGIRATLAAIRAAPPERPAP